MSKKIVSLQRTEQGVVAGYIGEDKIVLEANKKEFFVRRLFKKLNSLAKTIIFIKEEDRDVLAAYAELYCLAMPKFQLL